MPRVLLRRVNEWQVSGTGKLVMHGSYQGENGRDLLESFAHFYRSSLSKQADYQRE
jgi:hypothetical protein